MKISQEFRNRVLTERVRRHLESVNESSGLPPGEESLARITANWLEKRMLFEDQTRLLGMEQLGRLEADDERGAILLTYSGSLVALGRLTDEGRWFEYASIELRADVPALLQASGVGFDGPVEVNSPVRFVRCPVARSSDLLLIAVCPRAVSPAEEENRLREAAVFLTNGFVKINKTLSVTKEAVDHFTMRSICRYLASRHGVSQRVAKGMVDDYLRMVEAGILMGEKVPLGNLGRVRLGRRPAQKARVGRNPATGGELTIPARPEVFVPRMAFSARLKERAASLPVSENP